MISKEGGERMGILELIIGALIVIWILGFFFHLGGELIHILLILAVILVIARLLGFNL